MHSIIEFDIYFLIIEDLILNVYLNKYQLSSLYIIQIKLFSFNSNN